MPNILQPLCNNQYYNNPVQKTHLAKYMYLTNLKQYLPDNILTIV